MPFVEVDAGPFTLMATPPWKLDDDRLRRMARARGEIARKSRSVSGWRVGENHRRWIILDAARELIVATGDDACDLMDRYTGAASAA